MLRLIFFHLSGIATLTRRYVVAAKPHKARICCTRKTTPGLRSLQKYAVQAGGGSNHRFGLDDAVMIMDNHIAVVGDIRKAVIMARESVGHMVKVEVEVDSLDQLRQILDLPVDAVLLLIICRQTCRVRRCSSLLVSLLDFQAV